MNVVTKKATKPAPAGQVKGGMRRGKFLVQCTFIPPPAGQANGMTSTRLSDFANSLEEAEEYFHRQVQACPPGGGLECAVLLVLKDGKHTQVDGHSFGVTPILQNHDEDEENES